MKLEYFGDRLKSIRKNFHLTQAELASKLDLAKGTVSSYEQGLKYPSIEVLLKICEIFNVSSDYLLGLSDELPIKMSGLTDSQLQTFLQLIDIVEQYNNLKK